MVTNIADTDESLPSIPPARGPTSAACSAVADERFKLVDEGSDGRDGVLRQLVSR